MSITMDKLYGATPHLLQSLKKNTAMLFCCKAPEMTEFMSLFNSHPVFIP